MLIKVDLEKAYDRLKWEFIRETLEDVGVPTKIIETTYRCITSGSFRYSWNGKTTETVKPTWGI